MMLHNAKYLKTVGIFTFFSIIFFNNHNLCSVNAATLILKNGKAPVVGKILNMDEQTVSIENEQGEKSQIIKENISQIIFNDEAEPKAQIKNNKDTLLEQQNEDLLSQPSAQDKELFEQLFNGPNDKDMQQGPYVTPKHTFETWRRASVKGDMKGMVACYAKFRQNQVRKQLKKIPKNKRREMQDISKNTLFSLGQVYYQGTQASLEATWNYGLKSDSQVLKFVLEGKEWKLIQ
ncbi:MAG TPA: hypothetical protein PKB05_03810 [Oligoflexia bacterium]|nr:hypothetical protein [Oligoflexia bacterium]